MIDKYKGYSPLKMKYAMDFVGNTVLLTKSVEELVEAYNYLFDKHENPTTVSCSNCSKERYRRVILRYLDYGKQIYQKFGINLEEELKGLNKVEDSEVKPEKEKKKVVRKSKKDADI